MASDRRQWIVCLSARWFGRFLGCTYRWWHISFGYIDCTIISFCFNFLSVLIFWFLFHVGKIKMLSRHSSQLKFIPWMVLHRPLNCNYTIWRQKIKTFKSKHHSELIVSKLQHLSKKQNNNIKHSSSKQTQTHRTHSHTNLTLHSFSSTLIYPAWLFNFN